MNLIKVNPFDPTSRGLNIIDDFFNRSISDVIGADFVMNQPSVNVVEKPNAFEIELAVPWKERGDFEINIEKDQLIVSARKEEQKEEKTEKFTRREFNYSSFKRSFYLPETIDRDKIEAAYEKGILRVTLPKRDEEVKKDQARTIEIS